MSRHCTSKNMPTRSVFYNIILGLIVCLPIVLQSQSAQAEEARIEVEQAVWTNGIDSRNYTVTYSDRAPVAPLYLWMRVKGSDWALRELQQVGKLPIYHKWFRHSIIGVSSGGVTEMIKISAGTKQLVEQLQTEIDNRGFFDWRTWSMKKHINKGRWVVKVVYADGDPVLCEDQKPCQYEILVR